MNKSKAFKQEFKKNKYKYMFLITIIILGFLTGIIFSNILSYSDYKEISSSVENYFLGIKNSEDINYLNNFLNTFCVNFIYMLLLFIFGVSIVGVILNPFILYCKSFIIGFSTGIIISIYSFKGIIGAILFIFPHQVINMIIYLLLSYYGINLSIKLFKSLFLKKTFNSSEFMKKYFKIIGLSSLNLLISTLYETFLADFIMKVFTFLIK